VFPEVLTPSLGERPNSPMVTSSVSLNIPRCAMSSSSAESPRSRNRAMQILQRPEIGGVRVPGRPLPDYRLATAGQFICTKRVPALDQASEQRFRPKSCGPAHASCR